MLTLLSVSARRLAMIGSAMAALCLPAPSIAAGDAAKGKTAFARCQICHKVDKSGVNGLGPNLYGIVGRAPAAVKGFAYSPAMQKKGGKWTASELDAFLAGPAKAVPGNRMMFAGLSDAAMRADIIAYIAAQK